MKLILGEDVGAYPIKAVDTVAVSIAPSSSLSLKLWEVPVFPEASY